MAVASTVVQVLDWVWEVELELEVVHLVVVAAAAALEALAVVPPPQLAPVQALVDMEAVDLDLVPAAEVPD